MRRHLLGSEGVFLVRHDVGRLAVGLVEGVDLDRAVDLHRLAVLFLVEQDPAAEAPHGRLVGGGHDRIGPHGHQFGGPLAFLALAPGDALAQIELRRATGRQGQCGAQQGQSQQV
jgi:hypothetical protein